MISFDILPTAEAGGILVLISGERFSKYIGQPSSPPPLPLGAWGDGHDVYIPAEKVIDENFEDEMEDAVEQEQEDKTEAAFDDIQQIRGQAWNDAIRTIKNKDDELKSIASASSELLPPIEVGASEVVVQTPSLAGTHSHYRLETEPNG